MKLLCDACERLAEPGAFRVEGTRLVLTCARCGAESQLGAGPVLVKEAVAAAEPERPVVIPFARPTVVEAPPPPAPVSAADRCPKCATPKNGRSSCATCGLTFDLYRAEEDVIPQSARRDFAFALEKWGSQEASLVLAAVPPENVAFVGRLARHHLADFPGDPRAQGVIDALAARSMALASAAAQSEQLARGPNDRSRNIVMALALIGMLGILAVLITYALKPG
ncbi:MAG: hypothetical protein JST54_03520 [Deltaproteobacteria bacterium]|nr:hypothetical protein [Deltaproteobacteria bacterium]